MKFKEFMHDLKNLCLLGLAADAILSVVFIIIYLIVKSGNLYAALADVERTMFIIGAVVMLISAGALITRHTEISSEGNGKHQIFTRFSVFPIALGLSIIILVEGVLIDMCLRG